MRDRHELIKDCVVWWECPVCHKRLARYALCCDAVPIIRAVYMDEAQDISDDVWKEISKVKLTEREPMKEREVWA